MPRGPAYPVVGVRQHESDAGARTLERLYERYSGRIYEHCLQELGSPEEAEDVVQQTYLNAWRSVRRGFRPEAPLAWLLTIAQNLCRSRYRSTAGRQRAQSLETLGDLPAIGHRLNDELFALSQALGELPETQRRAFVLREWRGLSYEEIAAELNLSYSAVATHIFRGRRALAAALDRALVDRVRDRIGSLCLFPLAGWLRSCLVGGLGSKIATAVTVVAVTTLAPVGLETAPSAPSEAATPAGQPSVSVGHPQPSASAPASPASPVFAEDGATEVLRRTAPVRHGSRHRPPTVGTRQTPPEQVPEGGGPPSAPPVEEGSTSGTRGTPSSGTHPSGVHGAGSASSAAHDRGSRDSAPRGKAKDQGGSHGQGHANGQSQSGSHGQGQGQRQANGVSEGGSQRQGHGQKRLTAREPRTTIVPGRGARAVERGGLENR